MLTKRALLHGVAGVSAAVNSNQDMDGVWAEVEAGLTTGQK